MHRDGSYFTCDIQVTEQIAADGTKTFIGRLRHRKIEERVEKGVFFVKQIMYFSSSDLDRFD